MAGCIKGILGQNVYNLSVLRLTISTYSGPKYSFAVGKDDVGT